MSKEVFHKSLGEFGVHLTDFDKHVLTTHYDYDHVNQIYYQDLFHNVCRSSAVVCHAPMRQLCSVHV